MAKKPSLKQTELPISIQKIVAKGRAELQPSEILLYGSRGRGDAAPTSDFDLAFKGVTDDALWTTFYNFVQHDAATLYGVDLVRYETATEALRQSIDEEGVPILESKAA